jgi:hypothetical protein
MAAKRLLIVANELVADRPAGVPDEVWSQVREADEVRVVACGVRKLGSPG